MDRKKERKNNSIWTVHEWTMRESSFGSGAPAAAVPKKPRTQVTRRAQQQPSAVNACSPHHVQVTLDTLDAAVHLMYQMSRYIRELATTMHSCPIRIDLAISVFTLDQTKSGPQWIRYIKSHL